MRNTPVAKQIFAFASYFVENLHVLPNGQLLLSTLDSSGLLYVVDPSSPEPQAAQVANLPSLDNITGITGIAPLVGTSDGLYAVTGGVHTSFAFEEGSLHLYVVSLLTNSVVDSIPIPDASTLNGLAALPENPHILLSADSIGGRVLRIDTLTRNVSVAVESAALAPGDDTGYDIGINGLKVAGNFIYFTNSNLGTFGRLPIDEVGNQVGEIEILATSPSSDDIYDDFTFDAAGNAYVAVHSHSVYKVSPDGTQTCFAGDCGGSTNSSLLNEPTSVALANDGQSIFVSTGGAFAATPVTGGQVVQIWL